MTPRDELERIVHDAMFPDAYKEDIMCWPKVVFDIADAVIAEGWSKRE